MPKAYKKKTSYRKRPYRKKKKKYNMIPRIRLGGFPQKQLVRLRYVQTASYNAGAGAYSLLEYRANSLFDPNKTGVGHQPSNYDVWAGIYEKYTVLGAKCTSVWVPTTGTTLNPPALLVQALSHDGSTISTAHATGGVDAIIEQPDCHVSRTYMGSSANKSPMLIQKYSAKRFHGVKDVNDVDSLTALVTANPDEEAIFEVAAVSPDNTVDPVSVHIRTTIEYIVMFKEPKSTQYS